MNLVLAIVTASCTGATPEAPRAQAATPAPAPSGPSVVDELQAAKRDTATNEATMLHGAAQMHLVSRGKCPASVEDMRVAGMIAKVPVDPWGAGYVVACTDDGASLTVTSHGPDGKPATPDDVVVSGT